jgi:hypothetical protein
MNSSLVTVIQFGGHWCAVNVDENENKKFISNPLTEKVLAVAAAKCFAKENNLHYQEDALIFNKPVVTIWRALGCWVPAKIFDTYIQGAGITVEDKSKAIKMAEQLAEREGLECFPSIGESIFDNPQKKY